MARICRRPTRTRRRIRYRRPLPTTGQVRGGCNLKVHLFVDNVRKRRRHRVAPILSQKYCDWKLCANPANQANARARDELAKGGEEN